MAEPQQESLVDHDLWRATSGDDPFGPAPEGVVCDPLGWGTEVFGAEPSLQVWTSACPWVTVEQPLLADLRRGDRVNFRLWHDPLSADGVSAAYIGLGWGDAVVAWWPRRIPSPSGPVLDAWEITAPVDAGQPVWFHVHNHGSNSYHLLELSVVRGAP